MVMAGSLHGFLILSELFFFTYGLSLSPFSKNDLKRSPKK